MTQSSPTQLVRALQLLAHERACGVNAGLRVYDRLNLHFSPLVGIAGVQLLFMRSAKLAQRDFAALTAVSILDGASKVRAALEANDPELSPEAAGVLFGHFLELLVVFIGERLTTQVLRRAWPELREPAPGETKP